MEDWFNRKLAICQRYKHASATLQLSKFDKLVPTYQDIAPRNLIIGADGKVWLIYWGSGEHLGFTPWKYTLRPW
jgi:hypothetical protein